MSSFTGALVKLTLRNGDAYPAKILSVDPTTATLTVERKDTGETCQVRRDVLLDVSIVSEGVGAAAEAASAAATPAAPAAAAPAAPAPAPPSESKKKRSGKKKGTSTPTTAPPVNYLEEFDYTKSTQSFDKKKAWEEIRLLVMLNRRQPQESRQPMLAPDEMVLSPSERAENAAPAQGAASSKELEELKAKLERAEARQTLLEALTGVQIADGATADEYTCSLFADTRTATAHWRSRYVAPTSLDDTGVLRYNVRLPDLSGVGKDDAVLLSYRGPAPESDKEIVARLPDHFQSEVSVKVENAALFEQRLQTVAQGTSS